MAVSESKKKSNAAWDKEHMERLTIKYQKGMTADIKARAAALSKPVNRYIVDLIKEDLDRKEKSPKNTGNAYEKWLLKP